MQNKPNFPDNQMNASSAKTKTYELRTINYKLLKQTQSNPIELAFIGERRPAIAFSSSIALAKEEATAGKRTANYNETTCSG